MAPSAITPVTVLTGFLGSGKTTLLNRLVSDARFADRIVITKIDRTAADALEARLRALNPGAAILRASHGNLDPALLFETGLHRPGRAAPDATGWLAEGAYRRVGDPRASPHDPRISSFVWRAPEPVAWEDFERGLETLLELMGAKILRLTGLVSVAGEPGPRAVLAVAAGIIGGVAYWLIAGRKAGAWRAR